MTFCMRPVTRSAWVCLPVCKGYATDRASKSIVVPLMATVGINNKVTFLEKTGCVWRADPIRFSYVLTDPRTPREDMNWI